MTVHAVPSYWLDAVVAGLAVLGLAVSRAMESITSALSRPGVPAIGAPAGLSFPAPGPPPGPAS